MDVHKLRELVFISKTFSGNDAKLRDLSHDVPPNYQVFIGEFDFISSSGGSAINIDEVTGTIGRESTIGIEKDEEEERDTESDSVSGEVCSVGNKVCFSGVAESGCWMTGWAHIGVGHCDFFSNRIYNFTGKGDQDLSLDPTYTSQLKAQRKTHSNNVTTVAMDPGSPLSFNSHYYTALNPNWGLFQSDTMLLSDKESSKIIDKLLVQDSFFTEFRQLMKQMGALQVPMGSDGEIRKQCNVIN
ncbi:peroxidase 3-like [Eucalyptus grandis]|uniref:peroxidase 3-like n=1 Tax=Eucalyptus grandis TaxID=71139 RepID=UPI00192EB0C2|nr:peroxidase 3-like [Eucalyptus grandis]